MNVKCIYGLLCRFGTQVALTLTLIKTRIDNKFDMTIVDLPALFGWTAAAHGLYLELRALSIGHGQISLSHADSF